MDNTLASRAALVGHLTITGPAIAGILLFPFLGLRMFGPPLFVYYVMAGIALGWQWYAVALPRWKKWLMANGAQEEEVDAIAHRSGLAWPVDFGIGPFALHTVAAVVCGVQLGPWLLNRWYAWILPLTGMSSHVPNGNDHLQNLELVSIGPALIVGYLLSRHFRRFAECAWILPSVVLAFKLFTFAGPQPSVLSPHPSTRFDYFFVIQRTEPIFAPGFGGVDPIRVVEQLTVVVPFYAGLAYSIGALAGKRNLLDPVFRNFPSRSEPIETEVKSEHPTEPEKAVHEPN